MKKPMRCTLCFILATGLFLAGCTKNTAESGFSPASGVAVSGQAAAEAGILSGEQGVSTDGTITKTVFRLEKKTVKVMSADFEIPQFTGMSNDQRQDRLNNKIVKRLEKELKTRAMTEDDCRAGKVEIESKVTYSGREAASMLFMLSAYSQENAHPYLGAVTINLNLLTEKFINRGDLITDKQKLNNLLIQGHGKKIFDNGTLESRKEKGENAWGNNWKNVFAYMTENGIGVVLPSIYALGGYAVYELPSGEYRGSSVNDWFPLKEYDDPEMGVYQGEYSVNGEKIRQETELEFDYCSDNSYDVSLLFKEADFPLELLNLGILTIQRDKITLTKPCWLDHAGSDSKEKVTVCQNKDTTDPAGKANGIHEYIRVRGDEACFYSYDNSRKDGRYQLFVWKKNAGLAAYRTGYGRQGDMVRIWKEDVLENTDVLNEDFYVEGSQEEPAAAPKINNPYFPYGQEESRTCSMIMEQSNSGQVTLQIRQIAAGKKGALYLLGYNRVDIQRTEEPENSELYIKPQILPKNNYWYLYVTEKNIYSIYEPSPEQKWQLIDSGKLPEGAELVCQENEISDSLKENESGWHRSLEICKGDIRRYVSYRQNDNYEGRSILEFDWKKDVGLIGIRTLATSAGADLFMMWEEKYLKQEDFHFVIGK